MTGRPGPLEQLDRYFLAATIAHEYADDLHCELAELHADDVHTRKLLSESAAVVLKQMPPSWRSSSAAQAGVDGPSGHQPVRGCLLVMRGQRQAGVANAFDVCLLGLGAQLGRSGPQLLRSPFALAQPALHRTSEPLILLAQHRPR